MSLDHWYYLAGVGSFLVGLGGLIGLIFYAIDTRKIRRSAQQQAEAPFTPCVLIVENPMDHTIDASLYMKNIGSSAALNIQWRLVKNTPWNETRALGPSEATDLHIEIKDVIDGNGVECLFESLSGAKFSTTSDFSENTQTLDFRHTFRRASTI